MRNRVLLATDLDRTLLPNGSQEYDGSMEIFRKIRDRFLLVYVTGRNLALIRQAIDEYDTPYPDFAIAEVGTSIFSGRDFKEDRQWHELISEKTEHWDTGKFKRELSGDNRLRLQEQDKQNRFKLSYYLDNTSDSVYVIKDVTSKIKKICPDAFIVYSVDETHDIGLLDILPKYATKLTALEYLRKKLGFNKNYIVYCGDSGNDILPLTYGYKSILVRNAITEIKKTVRQVSIQKNIINNLHIIKKEHGTLNGYYVSGILLGLLKFGIVSEQDIQ